MGRLCDVESEAESDDGRSQYRLWASMLTWCAISYSCMLAIFVGVCSPDFSPLKVGLLPLLVHGRSPALFYAFSQNPRQVTKPKGIEIVALVPLHRPYETEILGCYLLKNLAPNGGFLDRVVFIPQNNDTGSLEWLTSTVEQTSSYSISETSDFPCDVVNGDANALIIWIDSGVVFLEGHTIPTMVKTKLDHPDSLIVSANVVNQAALEKLHSHPSISLPYRPELQPMQSSVDHDSWRASSLPRWKGRAGFQRYQGFSPPFKNHRWLPSDDDDDFDHTPIGTSMYSDDGPGSDDWTIKAQQHYSFLHHLELGDLHRYKFPIWTNPIERISPNFFCFMAGDAATVKSFIQQVDSYERISKASKKDSHENKDIIIDGKGLAAHYSSEDSSKGLEETDVLQRYRSYAREMVCPDTH